VTTTRTERPTVRARSGRRPLPPIIFLLVLALVAGGVWWNVFREDAELQAEQDAECAEVEAAPQALDPATVSVRVYNASDQGGLAQSVADDLAARGFTIAEVANDPTNREVTGVGEVRHGVGGKGTAAFVALYLPGAGLWQDVRSDRRVDLVLGPEFVIGQSLATDEAVDAVLSETEQAATAC
jgi:hypothetical protein